MPDIYDNRDSRDMFYAKKIITSPFEVRHTPNQVF